MKLNLPDGYEIEVNRVVLKLGTKQITDLNSINHKNIENIVQEIIGLRNKGVEFILTLSGAIGLGIYELHQSNLSVDKLTISQKQALAGLGQIFLMELFKKEFGKYGVRVGQVLLTHDIFENRAPYLNARNTLNSMLELGILPMGVSEEFNRTPLTM